MIDSLWESGADGFGDVLSAAGDGVGDLVDTAKDVGGMVKDGWNKFFG